MRYGVSLVASPIRTGRTPVAPGSSVPAWPTRRTRSRRRTSATTSNDVAPAPLSTTSTPERPTLTLISPIPRPRALRERHRARVIDELFRLDELLWHGARRQREPREPPVVAHRDTCERLAEPAERIGGAALV